jgi:hypothetical protein
MASRLAVFYAAGSKVLRRKVIPDCDTALENLCLAPGEAVLLLPLSQLMMTRRAERRSLPRQVFLRRVADAASSMGRETSLHFAMPIPP